MNESCGCSRSLSASTLWALVLGGLFILFLFFTSMTVKWWLMLPLAGASFYLFSTRRNTAEGFEKTLCDWGYWIVLAGFFLRDICLSSRLAGLYDKIAAAGDVARAAANI